MIRRLRDEELSRTPARALHEHLESAERARARMVVEGLRNFMQQQLALDAAQIDDLALALERALLLSLRGEA
jgi:hypothetical protein